MYNDFRKNLLTLIDEKKHVDNQNLAFTGLTTYIDKEEMRSLNSSFIKKSLFANYFSERNLIHHCSSAFGDGKKYFMPIQSKYLNYLRNKDRIIFAAPTSFGKTLLVKELIYTSEFNTIVYIVPTNALAYELEKSFKENQNFSEKKYLIFDSSKQDSGSQYTDERCQIFIGTQEKYAEISDALDTIDLFIIDEAYKLNDNVAQNRGYILARSFLDSITSKSKKTILLTPNGTFEGFKEFGFEIVETDFNAVDKVVEKIESDETYFSTLNECVKNEKTLLFFKSPHNILDYEESINAIPITTEQTDTFISHLESEFHPEWSVIKYLKKGILVHTGVMPKFIQNKMINYYNENKDFNLIIGTNSLSEGINTPTRNVFFEKDYVFSRNEMLVKNTIGRAGRLGLYPIGKIFYQSTDEKNEINLNAASCIKLSVSEEKQLLEVDTTENSEKLKQFCVEKGYEYDTVYEILRRNNVSYNRFEKFLQRLTEYDAKHENITNVFYFAEEFNRSTYIYKGYGPDVFLRANLNAYGYIKENEADVEGEKVYFNSFQDKFIYVKHKLGSASSDSMIINLLIYNYYSTIPYGCMPFVNLFIELKESGISMECSENMSNSFIQFRQKYVRKIIGLKSFDTFDETQQKVVNRLIDYGVSLRESYIPLIFEISKRLNSRFSTYDIINKIREISNEGSNLSSVAKDIYNKYIS